MFLCCPCSSGNQHFKIMQPGLGDQFLKCMHYLHLNLFTRAAWDFQNDKGECSFIFIIGDCSSE